MPRPSVSLTDADYRRMLDVVGAVAEARDPVTFAQVLPEQVSTVVGSDVTTWNDVDPQAGTVEYAVWPRTFVIPRSSAAALAELADEHPLIHRMSRTDDGSAMKISDFWTAETWHASQLYLRVYQRMGVEHQMAVALPAVRPRVLGLALNRAGADFTERDRLVLNLLQPSLAQSWRRAREHARLRSLVERSAAALHSDGAMVLLLTQPVTELTPGALTDLYRFFGRPSEHTALPGRVERWLERQRAVGTPTRVTDLSRPLTAERHGHRMLLRHLPPADGRPDALLGRISDAAQLPAELAMLRLSRREVEVLTLLTSGRTNAEIAAQLHVSATTVKHHLDHIYRKMGVRGRVQATAMALSIVAHQIPAVPS